MKIIPAHVEYILSCLECGGILGRCIRERLEIPVGMEVEVLADSEIPIDYDFSWGGRFTGGRQHLRERIVRHLDAGNDHLVLSYAIDPKKGDPLLGQNGSKYLFNGDDVYYAVVHGDAEVRVEKAIIDSDCCGFFLGIATKSRTVCAMTDTAELTNREIQNIVADGFFVILGVFDGEAYVVINLY